MHDLRVMQNDSFIKKQAEVFRAICNLQDAECFIPIRFVADSLFQKTAQVGQRNMRRVFDRLGI